jgi:hypothetical protein
MAQGQKTNKQPQDDYARRGKALASSVQRLRGWVGSDPSRTAELADALVELTGHRLRGHDFAGAATDGQEALRRAAQLLTANGPIGPYTSAADASRYVTAVVHVATIQAGIGMSAAAGRTMESMSEVQQQLADLGLDVVLEAETAIGALSSKARAALASGDIATANAYADAALDRLAAAGPSDDAPYLEMDVQRLASDCRWAAGRTDEALSHLHVAKDRYDAVAAQHLQQPGRLSPALLERLAEPLFGLYRDMADRLVATGELDLGLVTRRELVDILTGFQARLGDAGRIQQATAMADLASDLVSADRLDEAEAASAEAATTVLALEGAGASRLVVAAVRGDVLSRLGRSGDAVALLRRVIPRDVGEFPAAHAVGLIALAAALRADGDTEQAAAVDRVSAQLVRGLAGDATDDSTARSLVQDLARGVVTRGRQRISWSPLAAAEGYPTTAGVAGGDAHAAAEAELQRETAAWLEAQRAEAHRLELERLEQARVEAERREAERVEAERVAAEQLDAERARAELAERREAERRAAAEDAERLERKRRREESLEEHRREVERLEAERRESQLSETERVAAEHEMARIEAQREAAAQADVERQKRERWESERREAERVAAEREAERLDAERRQAERLDAERRQAERIAAEREAERAAADQEAERLESERVASQREAERLELERVAAQREADRVEAQRHAAEQAEQEELSLAEQAWRDARVRGDRRGARAANERVVELLRPRAEADLATYGSRLHHALEELSSARLRTGDLWGSRACAKEAKALARSLGR